MKKGNFKGMYNVGEQDSPTGLPTDEGNDRRPERKHGHVVSVRNNFAEDVVSEELSPSERRFLHHLGKSERVAVQVEQQKVKTK